MVFNSSFSPQSNLEASTLRKDLHENKYSVGSLASPNPELLKRLVQNLFSRLASDLHDPFVNLSDVFTCHNAPIHPKIYCFAIDVFDFLLGTWSSSSDGNTACKLVQLRVSHQWWYSSQYSFAIDEHMIAGIVPGINGCLDDFTFCSERRSF